MNRIGQVDLLQDKLLAQQISEVRERELERVARVYVRNVHFRLAAQEAFVDQVEEELEELGAVDFIQFHLLLVRLHERLIALKDGLEVELAVQLGLLEREDQDDDLGLWKIFEHSYVL